MKDSSRPWLLANMCGGQLIFNILPHSCFMPWQSPEAYLRAYLAQRPNILRQVLDARAPPATMACASCSTSNAGFRCIVCFDSPIYCLECMLSMHERLPFHHVEQWNGEYFTKTTLHHLGYVLHLCRKTNKCSLGLHSHNAPGSSSFIPPALQSTSSQEMTLISSSGIHTITVAWCTCFDADYSSQLMATRLFPATMTRPKTAFTFELLDHFLVDSTVCKTTAYSFYDKLRHLTDSANASSLPVSSKFSK